MHKLLNNMATSLSILLSICNYRYVNAHTIGVFYGNYLNILTLIKKYNYFSMQIIYVQLEFQLIQQLKENI